MQDSDKLTFHTLRFLRRDSDWVVSYEHTGSHVLVDDEGKQIIEQLHKHNVGYVKKKHDEYDLDSFITELIRNGLVHKKNNRVLHHQKHLTNMFQIPKSVAKIFVHPIMVGIFLGIIATGIYLLITQPILIPSPSWLFATSTLSILLPLIVLCFFAVSFVHELGHHIMLQVLGYSRALTLEHRWHLIRPKADTSKLYTLTEHAQTDVKLAGVITDLLIFSKALIITAITANPLAQLVALIAFVHLLGQTLIHPAADLHFVKKSDCVLCDLFKPRQLLGLGSLLIIVFIYLIPATYALLKTTFLTAQNPLTHLDGVIALILITATLSFTAAANLYDHQYNSNKAYQSIMISATTTALLLTVLLITFLIVA